MIESLRLRGNAGVPPEAPLSMPNQDLRRHQRRLCDRPDLRTCAVRLFVFGGAAALTAFGFDQMLAVFTQGSVSAMQILLLGLFTITFAWIGFAALAALSGLALGRPPRSAGQPETFRTALVMPLYNEDPAPSAAALQAMAEGLDEAGAADLFEIFILSDTRDPDIWVQETAAVARLRAALSDRMAVWYRRRSMNAGRKAGNIREFIERWGGRYDGFLILDADSVMEADSMLALAARMEAAPQLGILQTVPTLAGGSSLFARLQQFAGRLYGPVIARGTAAWQGMDGNYWGHNALIRTRAFAEACGLPDLPGRKPFGGHILSHDFVEAALIRRAGWQVRMDPDLRGSFEGSPPSLIDLAVRDRRWAQGNLQHSKVIGARGLRWPNRVHFAIGIGAYLMSPIWLAMLLTGGILALQAALLQHRYFSESFQLFPDWPVFDAERMLGLFMLATGLLLLPKLIGLVPTLLSSATARAHGGRFRVLGGFVAEIVLSALFAPVLMLMQVAQVTEILLGRDSGWSAQTREGGAAPWRLVLARHWHHSFAGFGMAGLLAALAPAQLLWLSPVLLGLSLAPALSRLSGSVAAGRCLERLGLLQTPEERRAPPALARAAVLRPDYVAAARGLTLRGLADDEDARRRHASVLASGPLANRVTWLADLTARAKIEAVEDPLAAFELLTPEERLALAASPDLLEAWSQRPSVPPERLSLVGE